MWGSEGSDATDGKAVSKARVREQGTPVGAGRMTTPSIYESTAPNQVESQACADQNRHGLHPTGPGMPKFQCTAASG